MPEKGVWHKTVAQKHSRVWPDPCDATPVPTKEARCSETCRITQGMFSDTRVFEAHTHAHSHQHKHKNRTRRHAYTQPHVWGNITGWNKRLFVKCPFYIYSQTSWAIPCILLTFQNVQHDVWVDLPCTKRTPLLSHETIMHNTYSTVHALSSRTHTSTTRRTSMPQVPMVDKDE